MNLRCIIRIICTLYSFLPADPQYIYTIDARGKPIQLDAFLIEWNSKNSRKISSKIPIFWDALNTSEGVAGYFRFPVNDSCEKITIEIFSSLNKSRRIFSMQIDTIPSFKNYYAVEKIDNKEGKSLITEWIIPWDSITVDSMGNYEIGMFTNNECDDAFKPVVFKGVKSTDTRVSKYAVQIVIQIAGITVLLALFIILKRRIKIR